MITAIAIITLVVGGGVFLYKQQTLSHYDQEMQQYDGFFTDLVLGEFFEIDFFSGSENAATAMDLTYLKNKNSGLEIFKDQNGYYLRFQTSDTATEYVRLYLPKDEWFKQFNGVVKSFKDRESEGSELQNKFSLLFYLKYPSSSIRTKQVDENGKEFYGPLGGNVDASRGWDVYNKYKVSGYFSLEGNKIRKKVEVTESFLPQNNTKFIGEEIITQYQLDAQRREIEYQSQQREKQNLLSKVNEAQIQTPGGLAEYTYQSDEYGKSDFDVWYDSSQGTLIIIGVQIAVGILTSGVGNEIMLGCETYAWGTAVKAGIVIGGELVVGLPEALYLYNRGYTSIAGLVTLCCFIPLITEFKLGRMILNLQPGNTEILFRLVKESKTWRTPREFLTFMKGLSEIEQKFIAEHLSALAVYYSKNGTKQIVEEASKKLVQEFESLAKKTSKVSAIKTEKELIQRLQNTFRKVSKLQKGGRFAALETYKFNQYPILSSLGFTTGTILVMMLGCVVFIENDDNLLRDPNGLIGKLEKGVQYFAKEVPKAKELLQQMANLCTSSFNTAMTNPTEENLKKAVEVNKSFYIVLNNLSIFYNSGQLNGWANADFTNEKRNDTNRQAYSLLLKLQCLLVNNIIQKNEDEKRQGLKEQTEDDFDDLTVVVADKELSELEKKQLEGYKVNIGGTLYPKKGIYYTIDAEQVNFEKSDFDQFLFWLIGVKDCSVVNTTPWFSNQKDGFSWSYYLYKSKDENGEMVFYPKTLTFQYGPTQLKYVIGDYQNMCKKFDRSTLDSDFYNCCFIRALYTNYFDNWILSDDYKQWQSKKSTSQNDEIPKEKTLANNDLTNQTDVNTTKPIEDKNTTVIKDKT